MFSQAWIQKNLYVLGVWIDILSWTMPEKYEIYFTSFSDVIRPGSLIVHTYKKYFWIKLCLDI